MNFKNWDSSNNNGSSSTITDDHHQLPIRNCGFFDDQNNNGAASFPWGAAAGDCGKAERFEEDEEEEVKWSEYMQTPFILGNDQNSGANQFGNEGSSLIITNWQHNQHHQFS